MNLTEVLEKSRTEDYSEKPIDCSWVEFVNVLTSRRSVRLFDATPVAETVVQNAIDAAIIAPNSSNLQQTEFYWVQSPAKRAALVEACLSQPAAKSAQEIVVIVARTNTWRRNAAGVLAQLRANKAPASAISYYEKLVPMAYRNGPFGLFGLVKRVLFFVKGLQGPMPREPKSHADMRVWAHKSSALAAENFMLAIRAQGFDTCPMEGLDSARVKKILGLKCGAEICMAIAVGKRAPGGVYGPRMRLDRKLFVFKV